VKVITEYIQIIALTGRAGSGKSTVAQQLITQHDFVLVKFAEPLKWMLQSIGLGHAEIEGDLKEEGMPLLSFRTPRYAMQTLGQEWGREIMGKDFWVNIWLDRVKALIAQGFHNIVVDDCRYPNEEQAVRDMAGSIWRVERPHNKNSLLEELHGSETAMDYIEVSEVIENTEDKHHLEFIVDSLMQENLN
jgi:hypothetical protein